MSKSNIAAPCSPAVEVLLFEFGTASRGARVATHRHPFWQFEMIQSGRADCVLERSTLRMKSGDLLLIPPAAAHGFIYRNSRCRYISTKFSMAGWEPSEMPLKVLPERLTTPIIRHAFPLLTAAPAPLRTVHGVVRQLLTSVIIEMAESTPQPGEGDGYWSERVWQIVAKHQGRKLTVSALAKRLGISTGYLSARFRAVHGFSIKTYLDRERARRAVDLLRYSDFPVGQIAEQMEFPDPFTFSRFVRKHAGISPRELRKGG